jgi:hypothetical protein
MAIIGDTELLAAKQDLIAARVQREIQDRAKLAGLFTDVSMFAVKGAKSISFPKLTSFTAPDRATGVAGVPQALTASVDTMNLEHRPYVSWLVDMNDDVQSTLNFQLEAAARAASAHGRRFDSEIVTEMEAVGIATTTIGAFSYAISLEMRDAYLSNEGDMDQAAWIMSGDSETALLNIDEYKRQDVYGPNGAIRANQMGTLFGAPVIRHNSLGASTFYLAGKEGLVYGFQRSPQLDSEKDIDYGTSAMKWAMDALFGVKGQLLGEGSAAPTQSALIIKDNN